VRGYEFKKGEYVQVTDAELDALEAEANSNIELKEFIPIEKVDPVYFEDAHYLAPDEGGDKAYRLLADAMEKSGRVALGGNGESRQGKTCIDPVGQRRTHLAQYVLRQ
jgi:DNA end-binding protein Ku